MPEKAREKAKVRAKEKAKIAFPPPVKETRSVWEKRAQRRAENVRTTKRQMFV
jgi:hypothetical protein